MQLDLAINRKIAKHSVIICRLKIIFLSPPLIKLVVCSGGILVTSRVRRTECRVKLFSWHTRMPFQYLVIYTRNIVREKLDEQLATPLRKPFLKFFRSFESGHISSPVQMIVSYPSSPGYSNSGSFKTVSICSSDNSG